MKKKGSAVAAAIALLVASCSSASPASTTSAALPTTTPTPTTTLAPSPATTAELTTTTASPSTTLRSEAVGSAELKEALIDEVVAEVGEANLGGRENVPFLDINNRDPLAAFASITAFDLWVFTTWPDPPMVEIYTVADSPGRRSYTAAANTFFKGGSRIVFLGSPYSAENARVVEPATSLPKLSNSCHRMPWQSHMSPLAARLKSEGWKMRVLISRLAVGAGWWRLR